MPLDDDTRRHIAIIAGATAVIAGASDILAYASCFEKVLQHMSILSRQQWVNELHKGHPRRFRNEMGMSKHIFNNLLEVL
jgi:hypothetical protein